ncbi:MAG: phosphatase PAP2 family protein, partial [Actinomycetota bacterium]|nr:phosphatase PAP2 family protein [Actinomycetota bacterium]
VQVALVTVAAVLYFAVRYVTTGSRGAAVENARRILDFEALLGLDIEQSVQAAVVGSKAVVTASNWIYMWAHWPVIVGTIVWLYFRTPAEYARFRNALFVSGAVGLLVFAIFPVAPPRLLHDGFVDTITEWSTSYRVLQPPALVNEYAAVPSFHVGWNMLAAIFLWRNLPLRRLRPLALISPIVMTLAVVLTANHYVFDAIAGAAVASFGLWVGWRLAHPKIPVLGIPDHA